MSALVSISVLIKLSENDPQKREQIYIKFSIWSDDSTCNVEVWGSATTSHGKDLADLQKDTYTQK